MRRSLAANKGCHYFAFLLCLLQEERCHTSRRHARHETRPIEPITPHHRIVVLIVGKICRSPLHLQLTALEVDFHLAREVRLVNDRNGHCAIRVLKRSHQHVLSAAGSINTNRPWASKAEVSCKSPETARDFETVVCEADKHGVTA